MRGTVVKRIARAARMLPDISYQTYIREYEPNKAGPGLIGKPVLIERMANHKRQMKKMYRLGGMLGVYAYADAVLRYQLSKTQNNDSSKVGNQDTEDSPQHQRGEEDKLLQVQSLD